MKTLYLDSNYLFRLYWDEPGSAEVLELVGDADMLCSAWHSEAEFCSILLRKRREGVMTREIAYSLMHQLDQDIEGGGLSFLSYSPDIGRRVRSILLNAPGDTFLRAADALHLACAAVNGFQEVYSHDKHFLQAAGLFGLTGMDVIA